MLRRVKPSSPDKANPSPAPAVHTGKINTRFSLQLFMQKSIDYLTK